MAIEGSTLNQHTIDDDYLIPVWKRPSEVKVKRKVVYCSSYACTTKNRSELTPRQIKKGPSIDKYKEIRDPPKSGWCRDCGHALFYTYENVTNEI